MARFCGNCGAALDEGVRFCAECGTPVEETPAAAPAATPPAPPATAAPPVAAAAVAPAVPPPPPPPVPAKPAEAASVTSPAPATGGYSGFLRRLLAYLIDLVLLTVLFTLARVPDPVKAIAGLAYFVVLWTTGGTLGMRILRIRLVDRNGKRPSPLAALLRAVGFVVSAVPLGLGFLWIAFDKRKQGWHDKIAGTFATRGAFIPAAAAAAPATGGHGAPMIVIALLVILVLLMGATAAAGYYMIAPDLPPNAATLPDVDDVKAQFPALAGATGTVTRSSSDEIQARDALAAQFNGVPSAAVAASPTPAPTAVAPTVTPVPTAQRTAGAPGTAVPSAPAPTAVRTPGAPATPATTSTPSVVVVPRPAPLVSAAAVTKVQDRQMAGALRSTGLPVTLVTHTPLSSGKAALLVGMDFGRISAAGNNGFTASVDSFVRLARAGQLSTAGADHVVVAVHDARGRVMFGAAAPSTAINQFRAGQIQQRAFLRTVAIKAESRAAVADSARRQFLPDFHLPWEGQ